MAYISNKKLKMQAAPDFKLLRVIYTAMDKFFLDPIIGLFFYGGGDVITSILTIPFIFTAVFRLRSVPLTLSIIYNALVDLLLGLIPVIGDIGDFVYRSYKRNYYDIVGYVENDEETLSKINGNALKSCILITIICIVIRWIALLIEDIFGLFTDFFGLF